MTSEEMKALRFGDVVRLVDTTYLIIAGDQAMLRLDHDAFAQGFITRRWVVPDNWKIVRREIDDE